MITNAKIAIVGLGTIGQVLAKNLIKGNRAIIMADRNLDKAQSTASSLGSLAQAMPISEAIQEADIVILSVWFDAIQELFATYASELQGKIIVDPSNPIAPDGKGGFAKKIDAQASAGQVHASLLPQQARLVKAFGTLGAASLEKDAFRKPDLSVLFYATDDTSINSHIETLIRDSGFEPLCIGGIDQSIRIEVFGDLHEFGGAGKTVTRQEATSLL